jgi:hypothetical protein
MEIILANDFTNDTLGRRGVRLMEIQNNIVALQPSLNVSPALFNWATTCYDIFTEARVTSSTELGEKEGATTELDIKETIMRETYTDIRGILLARYVDHPGHLDDFNFDNAFPDKTKPRMDKGLSVVKVSERHQAAGVPCVLPHEMLDRLRNVVADVRGAYEQRDIEKYESKHATRVLWEIYEADSARLAELLNWAKVMWGRYDVRFELIGMVPMTPGGQGGGGGGAVPLAPVGFDLKWLDPTLKFSWVPVEGATSYQLAFSVDGGGSWEELYSGAEAGFEYEPPAGLRQYRVRARNANGYGDWSVMLDHEVEGEPPAGEWPSAPSMLGVELMSEPSEFMRVFYGIPGGSDSISLYRAVVPNGDPAPERPALVYETGIGDPQYADTDIEAGNDYYYWACGVKDGIEGDFAGPAVGTV